MILGSVKNKSNHVLQKLQLLWQLGYVKLRSARVIVQNNTETSSIRTVGKTGLPLVSLSLQMQ